MFDGADGENVETFTRPPHPSLIVTSLPCVMSFLGKRNYCVADKPYLFMRDYRVIGNVVVLADETPVMTSLPLYDQYLSRQA